MIIKKWIRTKMLKKITSKLINIEYLIIKLIISLGIIICINLKFKS